ncbi:MAG: shikimate kinase [Pseudomonadota bacterium]
MKKHVLLIGMPGSGKSTIGDLLSAELQLPLIDTDSVFEARHQKPLDEIVRSIGDKPFLNQERELVQDALMSKSISVISPGGSIAYHQELRPTINDTCYAVYLHVPVSALRSRIANRPRGIVGRHGTFSELFEERVPLYRKLAHYEVDGDRETGFIVRIIKRMLRP